MGLRTRAISKPWILVAAFSFAGLPSVRLEPTALAADWDARDQSALDTATQLYANGRYDEAVRLLSELARSHPEVPSLERKLGVSYYYLRQPDLALSHLREYLARQGDRIADEDREDVQRWIAEMEAWRAQPPAAPQPSPTLAAGAAPVRDPNAPPSVRRGFLLLPYAGLQFPIHAIGWIASGLRIGTLIGGRLSRDYSLAGEPAVSFWSFSYCQGQLYCIDVHRAVQIDLSVTLLRHVTWPRAELVFGPKAGWAMILRHNPHEVTYPYVDGPQVGGRLGAFLVVTRGLALGALFDLSYILAATRSENGCFWSEPDCNDATHTVLGALTFAALY